MTLMRWLSEEELRATFKRVGRGVKVAFGATVIGGPEHVEIGDNVRIDHGAMILAGGDGAFLHLADHIHIACGAILSCGGGIEIGSFSTIGFQSKLISASDVFNGDFLVGPVFPPDPYTNVKRDPITLEQHAIVTTGCTILPGVRMGEGSVLGAMSLLKDRTEPWKIYGGIPAKFRLPRNRKAKQLGEQWAAEWARRGG